MYTENEYTFYEKVEKVQERYSKAGCGCGCLSGLLVIGCIFTSIITPSIGFDDMGKNWQKDNPEAQKVIKKERSYHQIQKNNQND